tara:strand:+ start:353 stop:538 length:186 start_codon:yes stop_codon:yes gene_type:complete
MTIKIEILNHDNTVDVSEFVVLEDFIQIINYYIELLQWNHVEFIAYRDGVPHVWHLAGVEI